MNLDEIEIIRILSQNTFQKSAQKAEGIGDDCAIIPVSDSESWVVSTDMLMEGSHFLFDQISPQELGYKTLAVNISDISAMGATPLGSFLSIAVNHKIDQKWMENFSMGYNKASEICATPLLGGDTVSTSGEIALNVTVIGKSNNQHIKRRNTAQPGDAIFVLNDLGDSAGGLRIIQTQPRPYFPEQIPLIQRHYTPPILVQEAQWLGSLPEVHAMMDISDGIAKDLRHILQASGVGAEINISKIPTSTSLQTLCKKKGYDILELALCGGEDYTLLITVENNFKDKFSSLFYKKFGYLPYCIGHITPYAEKLCWIDNQGVPLNRDFYGYIHETA